MRERTEYRDRHEEHPDEVSAQDRLTEVEMRLEEKLDGNEQVWPGDRGQAAGNFQKEARSWWRQNQGGLDPVDAELRIYQHGDCLDKQQEIARLQGRNLALTLGEMRDDYREFQFSISTLDAGVIAKRAAQNALDAQELIGHPMRTGDRYGEWTAESLRDELAAHLAKNGGRRIDPERVEQVFRDLEHIVDYGERLAALESDPRADAGCQHPMDRATEELVDWAIQNGEFNRWAQGKALGYDLDQAEREIFQLRLERENHLQELYGRAPDPAGEIPENVMQWARISQQDESWISDYREVLDALDQKAQANLPGWAVTRRGTVRRQGAVQLRELVAARLQALEDQNG